MGLEQIDVGSRGRQAMDLSVFESPAVTAGLAILTVVSLGFAIYSHTKNRTHQRLEYRIGSRLALNLKPLSSGTDPLVRFADQAVSELHSFAFLFSNEGTIAVEPDDIPGTGSIVIKCPRDNWENRKPDVVAGILEADERSARYRVDIVKNEDDSVDIHVRFDFMPPKSGVIMQGLSNISPHQFTVIANTKNFGRIRNMDRMTAQQFIFNTLIIVSFLGFLILPTFYFCMLLMIEISEFLAPTIGESAASLMSFGVFVIAAAALWFASSSFDRYAHRLMRPTEYRWLFHRPANHG